MFKLHRFVVTVAPWLVALVAGAVGSSNAIAGDWWAPFPSYTLHDSAGNSGYLREHLVWDPWVSNITQYRTQQMYVNVPDHVSDFKCYYLNWEAAYASDGVWHAQNDYTGWHANFGNTPTYITLTYSPELGITGSIEAKAGVASTADGYNCFFFTGYAAEQDARIPYNSSYYGCLITEQYPFVGYGNNYCWQ